MRRAVPALSACAAAALLLAGCGGSSSPSTASSSSGGSSSGSSSGGSSSFSLSKPVTLGFLWEIKGESVVAIDDYERGAEMAVDEINAAGGVGGQKVEDFRVPSSVLDPQKNLATFLQAVQKSPAAMIGLPAPTQAQQLASQITRAQIPVIMTDTGDEFTVNGTSGGSDYSWFLGPYNPGMVDAAVNYLVKDLKKTKIGLMGTNEAYGNEGVKTAKATLDKNGLKPFAEGQYSPTATDLTQQVLAMKGADAVFDWGYPNPVAVQLNQFLQNGLTIPTMTGVSVDVAVSGGLVKGQALANTYVAEPCDMFGASYSPKLNDFVQKYKAKYGNIPSQNASWAYDGVNVAIAAIKAAKSDKPADINKALANITVDGTCGTYHADGAHFLSHQAVIAKYDSNGTSTVVSQPKIAEVGKSGS